jgi:hypothetical protein
MMRGGHLNKTIDLLKIEPPGYQEIPALPEDLTASKISVNNDSQDSDKDNEVDTLLYQLNEPDR